MGFGVTAYPGCAARPRAVMFNAFGVEIEATDREIDALVYELYGFSDEEIRIVEQATAR